ncbi:MAG: protein rep [Clostridia bacterium]|nr:protein rep [Clostridia bacterium]
MSRRIRVNPLIAEYYQCLGEENPDLLKKRGEIYKDFTTVMTRRSNRILSCGRSVETKTWDEQRVHYVKRVKLCSDKFCGNCQKQLANARERKYTPLLDELSKHYDMYHITFTVPNVTGLFLPKAVGDIFKAFQHFIKIISGRKKIRGYDFSQFGYQGCIRSLEITMNMDKSTYHPHLHCIFVFRKGLNLDGPKTETNAFSYSYGRKVQQFSDFEVFVQKLWYLCYEGITVTEKSIKDSEGYSCIVNNADGNYHQIFKYAIKGLLDDQKAEMRHKTGMSRGITYEIFEDLYFALENRRAMQGYGCFYGLKFDEGLLDEKDETDKQVKEIIRMLEGIEEGRNMTQSLVTVMRNMLNNDIYFSKKNVQHNLNSLISDD